MWRTTAARLRAKTEIDLTFDTADVSILSNAVSRQLAEHGIRMVHGEVIEGPTNAHPDSQIGRLIRLYKRLDDARYGRRNRDDEARILSESPGVPIGTPGT